MQLKTVIYFDSVDKEEEDTMIKKKKQSEMLQCVFFLYAITHHSCAAKTETSTFSAVSVLESMELPPSTSLVEAITHNPIEFKNPSSNVSCKTDLGGMQYFRNKFKNHMQVTNTTCEVLISISDKHMFLNHSRIGAVIKLCKVMFGPESNFIFAIL